MDYKQFIQIVKDEKSGPDALSMLNEFVSEFPYFQTAQSLLAREMSRQQHVRYERQLKIAAAYSPDRKALYNLIHPKKVNLFSTEPVIEHPQMPEEVMVEDVRGENLFEVLPENEIIPPDVSPPAPEPVIITPVAEIVHSASYIEETFKDEGEAEQTSEELPPSDPHEIIRRRLNEILGLHLKTEEPAVENREEPAVVEETRDEIIVPEPETTIQTDTPAEREEVQHVGAQIFEGENIREETIEEKDIIEKLADESLHAVDVIDKGELEYALEASLIQSLEKLPLIEKAQTEEPKVEHVSSGTFLDWLKSRAVGEFGKVEEVHAYDEPEKVKPEKKEIQETEEKPEIVKAETSALIDKFIKEEPKIVVSKTEFYSPSIQAKKSITEHEDIVSETLAKIYHQQGNVLKARYMYEKLGLLYPEKKAYFAALIFQIDKDINQHNKQDL